MVVEREKERTEQERKTFFAIDWDGIHFHLKVIGFFLLLHYDYEKKENWFYLHLPEVLNRYWNKTLQIFGYFTLARFDSISA